MFKKSIILFVLIAALVVGVVGCGGGEPSDGPVAQQPAAPAAPPAPVYQYDNGRYRGTYGDSGEQQVSIQFDLTNDVISNVSFRHLFYNGVNFRTAAEGSVEYPVRLQHQQIAEYLEGKSIDTIAELRSPGSFVQDVDGYSGATIRGSKLYSAMRDALNRGLYTPSGDFSRDPGTHPDGRYRGTYGDSGEQQVSIQFNVQGNAISSVSFRHLQYNGEIYRNLSQDAVNYPVWQQHQQIAEYLEGKPLAAIFDLHSPGNFVEDVDGFSGATIRANKLFSAIMNGLSRNIYQSTGTIPQQIGTFVDGRYRGTYGDSGEQQVSVQFDVENNTVKNVSFRHLFYNGSNYRRLSENDVNFPVWNQHEQIIAYLEDKPLSAVFDLHTPGDFVDDVDGFSGATVRGNKIFSAMIDGLNRGLY